MIYKYYCQDCCKGISGDEYPFHNADHSISITEIPEFEDLKKENEKLKIALERKIYSELISPFVDLPPKDAKMKKIEQLSKQNKSLNEIVKQFDLRKVKSMERGLELYERIHKDLREKAESLKQEKKSLQNYNKQLREENKKQTKDIQEMEEKLASVHREYGEQIEDLEEEAKNLREQYNGNLNELNNIANKKDRDLAEKDEIIFNVQANNQHLKQENSRLFKENQKMEEMLRGYMGDHLDSILKGWREEKEHILKNKKIYPKLNFYEMTLNNKHKIFVIASSYIINPVGRLVFDIDGLDPYVCTIPKEIISEIKEEKRND